ncbi:MAG TPA: 6-phosphogluconolactonase, partial [Gallionella sp.]|nr:6-phosphogluconolactonase [Gallionella sp.]
MRAQITRWRVFPNAAELQGTAAAAVLASAQQAIAERGRFDIVLAGGTTPRA